MPHYKKVAKPVEPPLSFVAAVTKWGDEWRIEACSKHILIGSEAWTSDFKEAASMRLMERGIIDREGIAYGFEEPTFNQGA